MVAKRLSELDLDTLRQGYEYVFTVCTPTYNRAHTLSRVYESLLPQTFRDFEWVVVDDGSTDRTRELVEQWMQSPQTWFPIRYFWQPNQHEKVAFNRGVREARGRFFVCLDSDDALLPDALETFVQAWLSIPEVEQEQFAGVCGHCVDEKGQLIGKIFPCERFIDSNSLDMFYIHRVREEKFGFTRTDILREHTFPEDISGHVPESVVWHPIGAKYKTRFVNHVVRVYYRSADSLSAPTGGTLPSLTRNAEGLFYAAWLRLSENMRYFSTAPLEFVKDAARLTRFWLHRRPTSKRRFLPTSFLGAILALTCVPVGAAWYLKDLLSEWRHRRMGKR